MKQDQKPTAKIVMHEVQVGSPAYPDGISIHGTFEVEGWEHIHRRHWWGPKYWQSKPKTFDKDFVVPLNRKEVEAMMQEWSEKWNVFENFREVIINKAEARKAFDKQFVDYHMAFNEIFPEETYENRLDSGRGTLWSA